MKLGLAIVHAPWKPERIESLHRLERQLGLSKETPEGNRYVDPHPYVEQVIYETTRAANWAWSEMMWRNAYDNGHDNLDAWIFLQDDVVVTADFWPMVHAIVEGRKEQVIGLSTSHPTARNLFMQGIAGYTVADEVLGFGYIMRPTALEDFLHFRETELVDNGFTRLTEDSLVAFFCLAREHRIFQPIPCPIDHDLEIDSTYGNDANIYRRPQVIRTDDDRLSAEGAIELSKLISTPAFWAKDVPDVGRFYQSLHDWLPVLLRDKKRGADLYAKYIEQECPPAHRHFFTRVNGSPRP